MAISSPPAISVAAPVTAARLARTDRKALDMWTSFGGGYPIGPHRSGLGTGGGHDQFAGCDGPQSFPCVTLVKLPGPEIEPVSSGSRFSLRPQPVKRGMVSLPASGPPVGTVYPFGGIVFSPLPTRSSFTALAVWQCGPTSSGTPLTLTPETRTEILVLVRTVIGYGGAVVPDTETMLIGVSSTKCSVAVTGTNLKARNVAVTGGSLWRPL